MKKCAEIVIAAVAIVVFMNSPSLAQTMQSSVLSGTTLSQASSNYYYARANELTIIVNVIGFVQRPGRYEISNSIDLINLLALAGGGTPDASMNDVKITRLVEVDGRVRMKESRINLEEMARLTSPDLVLRHGDIIQVERSGWASFRDNFNVIVSGVLVTTAVASVIIASRR
jgi:hypothetical protein